MPEFLWVLLAVTGGIWVFFILTVAAAILEKKPVMPYYVPATDEDYDPSPAAERANDVAHDLHYRYCGVYHDGKPLCRVRYDFWISRDDSILALVSSGTVAKIPVNSVSMRSRTGDGQVLFTTNHTGIQDISGIEDQQTWPDLKFKELAKKHRRRLKDVEVEPFPAKHPEEVYFEILRHKAKALVARGYARYVDVDNSVWRYTLKGALVYYFLGVWVRPIRRFLRTVGLVRD